MNNQKKLKIVVYMRVNTAKQINLNSLQNQDKWIEKWTELINVEIMQTYQNEWKSGYTSVRPSFYKMIDQIKSRAIMVDCVVAYRHLNNDSNDITDTCNKKINRGYYEQAKSIKNSSLYSREHFGTNQRKFFIARSRGPILH